MSNSYERQQELFAAALALPAADRGEFLLRACGDDGAVRAEVEALLAEYDQHPEFLSSAAAGLAFLTLEAGRAAARDDVGSEIGRYRVLAKLGEGGCGVVYRAEQIEPVRREVALKVIKLGMDTRAVVARFDAERQALALMDHPGIARVFDAGATENGRPYFVMELVRGVKITEFCDRARLPLEQRLRLFLDVCGAVQHAHQKGIIHRDLKPSNILVASLDGSPTPKVIDFGVAKAMAGRLTNRTIFTAVEQFIGTPAYMSPEQAAGTDVDTRSDIYSLGVLLYELLIGRTPVDAAELEHGGVDQVRRKIRELDTPRPSVRWRTLDAAAQATAVAGRGLEPAQLAQRLEGDLDWIVLRCLEKDRARRYETANELARDVQRHLAHELVLARPPSRAYVWGKLLRRHRLAFVAGGTIGVLLVLGGSFATFLYFRAAAAEREQARLRAQAQLEAARSRQMVEFVGGMLQGVEPAVARGRDPAVLKELLDETVVRLDAARELQPEVEADLHILIGGVYLHIRQPSAAEKMQRRALALRIQTLGAQHPKVAESLNLVGDTLAEQRRVAAAAPYYQSAYAILQHAFGVDVRETMPTLLRLAGVAWATPDYPAAHARYRELEQLQKKYLARGDPLMARTLVEHARVYGSEGNFGAALDLLRQCLEDYHLPDTPAQIVRAGLDPQAEWLHEPPRDEVLREQSQWLAGARRYAEAEAAAQAALALERRSAIVNPDTLSLLAGALIGQGRYASAADELREAIKMFRAGWEKDPSWLYRRSMAESLCQLGECLFRDGQYGAAEAALRESLPLHRRHAGLQARSMDPGYLLAPTLEKLGRLDEAEQVYHEALDWAPARWTNSFAFDAYLGYDRLLRQRNKTAERTSWWREQVDIARRLQTATADPRALGRATAVEQLTENEMPTEQRALRFAILQIRAMVACDQAALAEDVARAHLAWRSQSRTDNWSHLAMQGLLGIALAAEHKFTEAEPMLIAAHDGLRANDLTLPAGTKGVPLLFADTLAKNYAAMGRTIEAETWKMKAAAARPGAR